MSGTTTLDVKKKWSFQTGGRSRQVQFARNPMKDRNFQKLENGLSRQGGLSRRARSRQVSLYADLMLLGSCVRLATPAVFVRLARLEESRP